MTDQELLEKAARAAGIKWDVFVEEPDSRDHPFHKPLWGLWMSPGWWNPLENDGDAFRLMHSLGLEPMSGETELDEPIYTVIGMGLSYNESPTCERHDIAGLRRAIVRAAAMEESS